MHFKEFSKINRRRASEAFGHQADLRDWTLSDWGVAMVGEAGEVCDVIKKIRRNETFPKANKGKTLEDLREQLKHEIGDVYAYLDLLATSEGLDIFEDCIAPKWDEVSERVGSPLRLKGQEWQFEMWLHSLNTSFHAASGGTSDYVDVKETLVEKDSSWREYFLDGYTPKEALQEDFSYG